MVKSDDKLTADKHFCITFPQNYNRAHKIMKHLKILVQVRLATSKVVLDM